MTTTIETPATPHAKTRVLHLATELRSLFPGGTSVDLRVSDYGPSLTVNNVPDEDAAMHVLQLLGAKFSDRCFGGYGKSDGRPWSWLSGFCAQHNLSVTAHFYGKVSEFPPATTPTMAVMERKDAPGGSL